MNSESKEVTVRYLQFRSLVPHLSDLEKEQHILCDPSRQLEEIAETKFRNAICAYIYIYIHVCVCAVVCGVLLTSDSLLSCGRCFCPKLHCIITLGESIARQPCNHCIRFPAHRRTMAHPVQHLLPSCTLLSPQPGKVTE